MSQVWATSYGLYNQGRLFGKWYDLEDYADKEDLLAAIEADLAPHDPDPEIMFCDWEDVPPGMVTESHISEDLWEWLELSDNDRQLLAVYRDNVHGAGTIDEAQDAFYGSYSSEAHWAEEYWDSTGMLNEVPEHARSYIDFESFARDCRCGGSHAFVDVGSEVWVFRTD